LLVVWLQEQYGDAKFRELKGETEPLPSRKKQAQAQINKQKKPQKSFDLQTRPTQVFLLIFVF
jgi:hypothetical protein